MMGPDSGPGLTQADLGTLAAVCQLGIQPASDDQLPSANDVEAAGSELSGLTGPGLLTWLHDHLQDADASTTPTLQVPALTPFCPLGHAWFLTFLPA